MGELDLAAGRLDAADERLTSALVIFHAQGAVLCRARTLRDLSRLAEARGDEISAKAALSEAIKTFRTYGSREYADLTTAVIPLQ